MAECLPSVLRAAEASRHRCEVVVIDNDSTDDSMIWLAEHFPEVRVIARPNRGLCSFNDVVPHLEGSVAILLNNDIKLDRHSIDPLVQSLLDSPRCFMTAPLCWQFDGHTYEGFKTAIRWRWGLIQATARYPGHETTIRKPGLTASAGAALAVDCRKFAELGGFDPLYLPGRLEDLDFAFRGYRAGYYALYVPSSVMYHLGMATFRQAFGTAGCDQLALRNTLLFQWKNLRHRSHLARQVLGLPLRLVLDVCRAPWLPRHRRWMFVRAIFGALGRLGQMRATSHRSKETTASEREFFRRFHPQQIVADSRYTATRSSTRPRPTSKKRKQPKPQAEIGRRLEGATQDMTVTTSG